MSLAWEKLEKSIETTKNENSVTWTSRAYLVKANETSCLMLNVSRSQKNVRGKHSFAYFCGPQRQNTLRSKSIEKNKPHKNGF